jgi:hypothetical protein
MEAFINHGAIISLNPDRIVPPMNKMKAAVGNVTCLVFMPAIQPVSAGCFVSK